MTFNTTVHEDMCVFMSATPFEAFVPREQVDPLVERTTFGKPRGLWYGVGPSWIEWLRSEMPDRYERMRYLYRITIVPSRVFHVRTLEEIELFERMYARKMTRPADEHRVSTMMEQPDWRRLALTHSAIEIAPYQWSARLEKLWYYGWDVASGCVWGADAIAHVDLLEAHVHKPARARRRV